jgi:hypothetical protein
LVQIMVKSNLLRRQIVLKIVTDPYAWIEHFIGSENGRKVDELLENA